MADPVSDADTGVGLTQTESGSATYTSNPRGLGLTCTHKLACLLQVLLPNF